MPFEFKTGERKHPREYGGSPFKALLAEISDFEKQHRRHSLRRYAGVEKGEEEPEAEDKAASSEDCEGCKKGDCDNPEHLSEDERGGLEKMLGEHADDHDFED